LLREFGGQWGYERFLDTMDAVVLSVDVGRHKPHPDIYRAALRHREKPDGYDASSLRSRSASPVRGHVEQASAGRIA
jgi:hypothetical protein